MRVPAAGAVAAPRLEAFPREAVDEILYVGSLVTPTQPTPTTRASKPSFLDQAWGTACLTLMLCACGGSKAKPASASPADATHGGSGASSDEPASSASPNGGGVESEAMQLFLLIGQSNMEGAPPPQAEDASDDPRVQVLGYDNFGARRWNEWAVATPPLHRSWAGLGPGDYFGRAMAKAWPDATIGLIPCAISGVDIDFFRKGVVSNRRGEFEIPPDNSSDSAYDMVIERARLAQERGVIRGILFHQGESDSGSSAWLGKVKGMVADLRADLGLSESVPFVAGELLYSGCCAGHNALVNQLPDKIPNAHVVSAEGLTELDDRHNAHFDAVAQREFGRRYAEVMLRALE